MRNNIITAAFVIFLFTFITSIGCESKSGGKITVYSDNSAHPVLHIIEIEIPQSGLLVKVDGKVRMTRKGWGEYSEISEYYSVSHEDILELSKGASLLSTLENGSDLSLGPFEETKWYLFINKTK